ncbi:response regulator transcription factor [Streptomyces sp. NPDC001941]|uniref:response regulator transcription factor n=1 Tax=Streptomyces sp. NPDC001941 TaxID=3154659 RepID=UPI0033220276
MGEPETTFPAPVRRAPLLLLPGGGSAGAAVRVYVLGADALARGGIRALLAGQPAAQVVGDGAPGPGATAELAGLAPDVVVAHDGAAPGPGAPDCRVLTIGGRGQLPATATPAQLAAAVVLAAAGYRVTHDEAPGPAAPAPALSEVGPDQLTEREREVLALLAHGLSNTEIALALTLSEHTVKTHVQNLLAKLRLRNRVHAAIYAFETGLRAPR